MARRTIPSTRGAGQASKKKPAAKKKRARKPTEVLSVEGEPQIASGATPLAADPASRVYNHVHDCVMMHFVNVRPATPVNFIYPDLNIWRGRADLIAQCVKTLGPYYSHLSQAQLAVAIAAMHERSVNGLIYGIYQLRRGA